MGVLFPSSLRLTKQSVSKQFEMALHNLTLGWVEMDVGRGSAYQSRAGYSLALFRALGIVEP